MNEVCFVKLDTMTEREREGGGCGGCLGEKNGDGGWDVWLQGCVVVDFHERNHQGFCRKSNDFNNRSVC